MAVLIVEEVFDVPKFFLVLHTKINLVELIYARAES